MRNSNAYISFVLGLREGEKLPLETGRVVIGRDVSAGIQLDSPYVSRRHAELSYESGYWLIIDLYSKNGVFRNLSRIQPGKQVPIQHRDQIQIGSVSTFEFFDPEATVHQSKVRMLVKGLWIDSSNLDVYIGDQRVEPPLSPQQFSLLSALVEMKGDIIRNEVIAAVLWPEASGGIEPAAIDNAISRLRDRLYEFDHEHDYLETVRSVGRRFVQRKDDA